MNNLDSIKKIASRSHYESMPEKFFGHFPVAWKNVAHQVLKLETKQNYVELGNESYELMMKGDINASLKKIRKSLAGDEQLYKDLKKRGIDFIRCRPVKYPLTDYLKWEFETYKFTSENGIRIFCCNYDSAKEIFEKLATNDFMVFDSNIAFIHDYDDKGLIRGGWIVDNTNDIQIMQSIFISIKSISSPFQNFIK